MTNVEALLYLTLALWWVSRARPQERSPVHWAALFWALALLASAAAAVEFRGAGAKFALRQIGGALLFFAVADLLAAPRRAVILAGSYAAGAVISAAAAVLETAWAPAAEALLRFKTQPSVVEGVLRASGTLQYANLAAMAWGMALPMTTALLAVRRGALWWLATGAGTLVLVEALVRSASRAGLLTALLVLAAIAVTARGRLGSLRGPALLALASLVCLAVVDLATHRGLALRLRDREDRSWFDAEFRVEAATPQIEAGSAVTFPLRARNVGRLRWWAAGEHALSIGYSWLTEPGGSVHVAAPLPRDVEPGDSVTMDARVLAPRAGGRHRLRWLLTGDGVAWVSPQAGTATDLDVEVRPTASILSPRPEDPAAFLLPQQQPTRPALWRAGLALWSERPVFGVGPDNFRRLYARKLGPHPLDERVHANSLYVEVLATLGLSGATSLAALAVALAMTGARALRSADPGACLVAAGAVSGLAAFFVHGFLDYGLEATALYGAFWLLAGLIAGVSTFSRSAKPH